MRSKNPMILFAVMFMLTLAARADTWSPGNITTSSPNWQIVADLTNNFLSLDTAVQIVGGVLKLRGSTLLAGSVSNAAIADSQITSAKIADGTIVNADIANATILAAKLGADVPTAAQIHGATGGVFAVTTKWLAQSGGTVYGTLRTATIASTTDVDNLSATLVLQGADGNAGGGVLLRSGNTGLSVTPGNVVVRGGVSSDGVYTGAVSIINVPLPTVPHGAASKQYVDSVAGSGGILGGVLSNSLQVVSSASIAGTNGQAGVGGPLTIAGGASFDQGGPLTLKGGDSINEGGDATLRGGEAGAVGGNVVVRAGRGTFITGTVVITEVVTPVLATDAANKGYVDSAPRPLRGPMSVTNDPGPGLATEQLVDGSLVLSNYAGLGGMAVIFPYSDNQVYIALTNSGAGSVGAKVVVGEPTAAAHAATKGYVDVTALKANPTTPQYGGTITVSNMVLKDVNDVGTYDGSGHGNLLSESSDMLNGSIGCIAIASGHVDGGYGCIAAGHSQIIGTSIEGAIALFNSSILNGGGNIASTYSSATGVACVVFAASHAAATADGSIALHESYVGGAGQLALGHSVCGDGADGAVALNGTSNFTENTTAVGTPTMPNHATTKAYVDALLTPGTPQFDTLTNALKAAGVF
ncbi:hypothetical protein GX586_14760 [bacterium]|nr:hypothetical protein [bacterium]